jgi:hypothetical protein
VSIASKVALHKFLHPEKYCVISRCLWRTDAILCPRHALKPKEKS